MTRSIKNRSSAVALLLTGVTAVGLLVSQGRAGAQTTAQQIIDDAAGALGGRDRVVAVKTMLLEGAGNFVGITSLRYDDDIGFKSANDTLPAVSRAHDG